MTPRFNRDEFCLRFGERLRIARKLRGLSQESLAHRSGYYKHTISNLERGYSMPSITVVHVLSETLEVQARWMLFGNEGDEHGS